MGFGQILVLLAVALVLFFVFRAVRIVRQGWEYTVESFGRYTRTLKPGLTFLIPFYERIGHKVNMRERVIDVPSQEVITKDNAMVTADAVVFIQVIDPRKAAYEVNNLDHAIQNLCLTNVRTVVGSMDLDEVLSRRDEINARLLTVIDRATDSWGTKVTRIEIKDLSPPADITQAMNKQMKAEREKRADILMAEGHKQSQILKAEGEKQSAVREAEGRREAAFLDAEAREREAEAEAKATTMVSQAIAKGDVNAINYFVAQDYVKAFEKLATSPNQKTLIVPAELSSLAGTLAGIKTLIEGGTTPSGKGGK
ncbi:membrane protein [Algimonas ampicilliniresistens]|uniref:Protein QmcA n=1 Tax=Algimonas ampicilliniresistens TaxID=1298735 RepID=A0ABQ5VCH7_9PROT|nr:SPFH domain-containing protein [Algimonas ampicilliniresistens]GLQ24291.1 membrane protein [Algimonas ampicilliniresistens]